MTTQFTEENYQILYDEQKNVVEIRFQGINALQLFSLQTQLDALNTSFQNSLASVTGNIGTLQTTVSGLTSLTNAINFGLSAEESARLAADVALGTDISLNVANLQAAIDAEVAARAAALLAEAEARNVAIVDATAALVTDQAAMAVTIQGLATSLGAATANIINVQDAISTETAARAAQFSAIQADFGNTNAAILEESVVRSNSVDALASQIETLAVSSGTTVFIQPEAPTTGMVTGDAWYDSDDGNKAYRYDGAQWVDVTDIRIVNNAAAILAEQTARASGDTANATSITNLTAIVNVKTQTFAQPNQPTANAIGDIWIDTDSLPANLPYRWNGTNWILIENPDIAANKAAIQTEAQARADADSAEALARTILAARVTTNEGDISDNAAAIVLEQQARANAISAEAGQRAILAARVDDAEAAILLEQTARSDGDSANADLIGTLTTNLGDLTTTVSNETSARIAADGAINAKYGVKVNANGHVAGFGLIVNGNTFNGTVDSEFTIDATRFKVYNGIAAIAPFQVSGNTVSMQNVVIQDALIQNLTVGKLTSGTFNNDFNVGTTGKVRGGKTIYGAGTGFYLGYSGGAYVFDIGTTSSYLRWTGSGLQIAGADITLTGTGMVRHLGTNVNDTYIDWYGPTGVTVNDANAKWFIKKTGETQFIGRIRGEFEVKAWGRVGCNADNTTRMDDVFNVASVTRLGEGQLQVTFHTALANNNYAVVVTGNRYDDGTNPQITAAYDPQTTGFKIITRGSGGGTNDAEYITFVVFGSNVPGSSNVITPGGGYGGGTVGGGVIP